MKVSVTALFVLLSSSAVAYAQNTNTTPAPVRQDATRVCETGQGNGYGHPSNACWIAYEAAIDRRDSARGLQIMQHSCGKYQRADHCLFVDLVKKQAGPRGPVKAAAATEVTPGKPQDTTLLLHPADHQDGEAGVIFYDLLRSGLLTGKK